MLKINHVSKKLGSVSVLNHINLTIESRQIIGLAGPSGSGKTTLLRCIQGFEKPDEGSIMCEESTGFMFQDFQLFPHMTVWQNLIYAPSNHKEYRGSDYQKKAQDMLKNLGLSGKKDAFPKNLSGGQKQRVALARSLMMSPKLLLCDEPTSGLDVATTTDVSDLLKQVMKEEPITMIIASHDLDFLAHLAHRIILMKDGSIVRDMDVSASSFSVDVLKRFYDPD